MPIPLVLVRAAPWIGRVALPTAWKVIRSIKISRAAPTVVKGAKGVTVFLVRVKVAKEVAEFAGGKAIDATIIKSYDEASPPGTRKEATEAVGRILRSGRRLANNPRLMRHIDIDASLNTMRQAAPGIIPPFVRERVIKDALVGEGVNPWIITAVSLIT